MLDESKRYAAVVTVEAAETLFQQGTAVVITDGEYVQFEDDRKED